MNCVPETFALFSKKVLEQWSWKNYFVQVSTCAAVDGENPLSAYPTS